MPRTTTDVVILGATGRTGFRVVQEALRTGHRVTAAVRSPEKFPVPDIDPDLTDQLRLVRADVRDGDSLAAAVDGQDAVVFAVGPPGRRPDRLYSDGTRAALAAMRRCGVDCFIAITSAGVRYDDPELALWYRVLVRPLIRDLYADMALMEQIVRASDLDWTLVRPVLLVDRGPTGEYRVLDGATPRRGRTITRTDLARFIVGELDRPEWSRRAPTLAH